MSTYPVLFVYFSSVVNAQLGSFNIVSLTGDNKGGITMLNNDDNIHVQMQNEDQIEAIWYDGRVDYPQKNVLL